jgi:hypothetical protein
MRSLVERASELNKTTDLQNRQVPMKLNPPKNSIELNSDQK